MKISLPAVSGLRWGARLALLAVLVLALAVAFWWAFVRPQQMRDRAAAAKAAQTLAASAPAIARDTLKEVERFHERTIEIREQVAGGNAGIAAAAGASASIPADVAAAGRAAVCMHAIYRDDPGCADVQRLRSGEPVAADNPGAAAG